MGQRQAMLAALAGVRAEGTLQSVEEPRRAAEWIAQLGRRYPDLHVPLADALTGQALVDRGVRRLLDLEEPALRDLVARGALARFALLACQSALVGRWLQSQPGLLGDEARAIDAYSKELAELRGRARAEGEGAWVQVALRLLRVRRRAAFLQIMEAEIERRVDVLETMRAISDVADAAVLDALGLATACYGVEDLGVLVLGMGKLGARELNFASDIDLIYVCARTPSAEEVPRLQSAVKLLTRLLDEQTSDGFVFRVDLRLRPFGTQGPLVVPSEAMVGYYEAHGRTWERAALVKARVIGADRGDVGARLLQRLQPFVYRRYLDAQALRSVAELKQAVDSARGRAAALGPGPGWDVKLGKGGIREIELFVIAFQLVYGGREPNLRVPGTIEGMRRLTELGLISARDLMHLIEAYRFFRWVEHRLQMDEDRQTHRLPQSPEGVRHLAWRLGFEDAEVFTRRLASLAARVEAQFGRLLADAGAAPPAAPRWATLWEDGRSAEERLTWLAEQRVHEAARVLALTERLAQPPRAVIGRYAPSAERVPAEALVAACLDSGGGADALSLAGELLERRATRTTVLELLRASPTLATALASLFSASTELGRRFVREPVLIERLLAAAAARRREPEVLAEEFSAEIARADAVPEGIRVERRQVLLRRARAGEETRVMVGVLSGRVPWEEGMEALSDLAEVTVRLAWREAWRTLADAGQAPRAPIGALAFGKLGARELGFGADLDLAFVYHGEAEDMTPCARAVQRWLRVLSTPMAYGKCYEVDLRLRPDGRQGTVVTSVSGWQAYYEERAHPWELVALWRARPVAGPTPLQARLRALLVDVLKGGSPPHVRSSWSEVRAARIAEESQGLRLDIKRVAGGLMDLEQSLALLAWEQWRQRPRERPVSTLACLRYLVDRGRLEPSVATALETSWRSLRRLELELRLRDPGSSRMPATPEERRHVLLRAWRSLGQVGWAVHEEERWWEGVLGPVRALLAKEGLAGV